MKKGACDVTWCFLLAYWSLPTPTILPIFISSVLWLIQTKSRTFSHSPSGSLSLSLSLSFSTSSLSFSSLHWIVLLLFYAFFVQWSIIPGHGKNHQFQALNVAFYDSKTLFLCISHILQWRLLFSFSLFLFWLLLWITMRRQRQWN